MSQDTENLPRPGEPYPAESDRPYEHERMEGEDRADDRTFLRVVADAAEVAAGSGVPYVFVGGIASSVLGRERWTHDVDLMVRPEDARTLLRAFAAAGYETEERDQKWLYKAYRDDVMVDLIFRIMAPTFRGAITLDDELLTRSRTAEFYGVTIPVIGPEDLLVSKALVHKEFRARHWFDALGLIAAGGLDWDRVVGWGGELNPRRLLSLLLYAQSDGLAVPAEAVSALVDRAEAGSEAPAGDDPAAVADGEPDAYLVGRIMDRFARDHRTSELEVDVELEDGVLVLTGSVATPERRAALTQVASTAAPGRRIRNLVTVAGPPAEPTVEHVERVG